MTKPITELQARRAPALGRIESPAARALAVARTDGWLLTVFTANVLHVALFSRAYPEHRFDPDLLAYFAFFRNWMAGDTTLQHLPYYTGPKALLVFALGPLGDTAAALACTAVASALLGTLVYLVARDAFGRGPALAASLFLLLDPSKAFLTLKSSADLYLALFLFLAIMLAQRDRLYAAAGSVLLAALVKPVMLPCALYFMAAPGTTARRVTATLIPFAAVPLILLTNHALLGSALGGGQYFAEFASMAAVEPLGPGGFLHYVVWSQLIKIRFVSTASWGLLGLLLWVVSTRTRLRDPLLLMPLLFLGGYLGLSAVLPFPPYFRYFWPLEVWFLLFVAYGVFEGARRLAEGRAGLRRGIIAVLLVLLADSRITQQLDYRRDYALPIERTNRFAGDAIATLRARMDPDGTIVAPLGLLPYLTWKLPAAARPGRLDIAERLARDRETGTADWILDLPGMYKTPATRQWIAEQAHRGSYRVYASDGESALLVRPGIAASHARTRAQAHAHATAHDGPAAEPGNEPRRTKEVAP